MSEEIKNEEVKSLDRRLARMIIGSDDNCDIEIFGYKFKVHSPTLQEQLQIQVMANNLRSGVIQGDIDLKILTNMIATFDVLCTEIIKVKDKEDNPINPIEIVSIKDEKGNSIRKMKFWEFLQNQKNPKIFESILIPLFEQYLKFQDEVSMKYDDLKN